MEPLDGLNAEEIGADLGEMTAPRARDWLWKPWYAKLWWACIAFYWSGKLASHWIPALDDQYSTAMAGVLNVAFFPLIALMLLGLNFARAWIAWSDWELVEVSPEKMLPQRSVGGLRDPYSDPLDPRSGMLHFRHFHPGK